MRALHRLANSAWKTIKKIPVSKILLWVVGGAVALLLAGPALAVFLAHGYALVLKLWTLGPLAYTETLQETPNKDLFADLRNIGLVLLGLIGLPLAIWRSVIAFQQHRLSENGLIIDRFQKGAQMLESDELSVRFAGIYALRELALSDPDETYIMVQDLLCDFVRERSKERTPDLTKVRKAWPAPTYGPFAPDLQRAVTVMTRLREQISVAGQLEAQAKWSSNLRQANLFGANLIEANLSSADLTKANLSGADLMKANLSGANLAEANLSRANLMKANLSGANLAEANLSRANLIEANLSSARLNDANLSGARLEKANLSDARLMAANLSEAKLTAADLSGVNLQQAWVYRDTPTKTLPKLSFGSFALRNKGEPWIDFVKRIMREQPELGWSERMYFIKLGD